MMSLLFAGLRLNNGGEDRTQDELLVFWLGNMVMAVAVLVTIGHRRKWMLESIVVLGGRLQQ